MAGKSDVVECTFIKSDVTETPYFATPVLLGKNGVEQNLGMGELSEFEKKCLEEVCLYMQTNSIHNIQCGQAGRVRNCFGLSGQIIPFRAHD